jgi:transposase InsO family protein
MAAEVTAMDVKMLVATLPDGVKLAPWCRKLGISRQTAYKWRARYRREGLAGLEDRSRAAKRPAGRISAELEDQIVAARKHLWGLGLEGGPASVQVWLEEHGVRDVPSEATIWRVFVRRGQVVPAPNKRPKVSYRRFVRERPNECWQIDATHVMLATDVVEVINIIDDCSRLCVESFAVASCTSPTAWQAFSRAAQRYGLPAEVLSDNGAAFRSYAPGARPPVFERNVRAVGIRTLHSRAHHPQTCGKVERFHQTQKRWLAKQPTARTLATLQRQLDRFRTIYNEQRPHRSLGRRHPADVWNALPKAQPAQTATDHEIIIRNHRVWVGGAITLAANCIVVLGRAHAGRTVTTIRRGNELTVIAVDTGDIIRELTIDPARKHQPLGRKPSTTRPRSVNNAPREKCQ